MYRLNKEKKRLPQPGFQAYYNITYAAISWSQDEENKTKQRCRMWGPEMGNRLILSVERNTSSTDQCGLSNYTANDK